MKRLGLSTCVVALVMGAVATPPASAQQSINFYVGGFVPPKVDRGRDDVLFNNAGFLLFDMRDFNGVTAGAEYLVGLNDLVDAGLGVGIYSQTSPAIYRDYTFANGDEIEQDLKLRIVPFTATIRFLPLGHRDAITPYVGGGVGVYRWRYTETGNFLHTNLVDIFRDTFVGAGTSVGPVVLGGLRFPIGGGGIGFEYRYHGGEGDLPAAEGFQGPKINLSGHNVLFTVNIGF